MDAHLPLAAQQLSAVFLFALSIFMAAVHVFLFTRAAHRAGLPDAARTASPLGAAAFLALWLAVALSLTAGAGFPADRDGRLLIAVVAGYTPVAAAVALLFFSRTISSVYTSMPPDWLIRVQTYRMAGLIFLYPFLYYGAVPAAFALPAAIGDFLTGLFAPVVASAVARRAPGAPAWAVAWNLFGLLDLIVAPAAAIYSQSDVLQIYPLAVVPFFLGPPLGILTHIYSLRNLAAARDASSAIRHSAIAGLQD
jgi:hypothetical protein